MSQEKRLLEYLQNHVSITPLEALSELGIYRLSGRIYDLRASGHNIVTNIIEVRTAHGENAKIAEYRLVER